MKPKTNQRARLQVEKLECRNLMAGNVNAYTSGGHLHIEGDDASNVITIESYRNGIIQVRGFSDPGTATPTVVNRGANALRLFYGVTGDIVIHMKGGNDLVRVTNLVVSGNLTIDLGSGYDQLATGRDALIGAARFGGTLPGPLYVSGELKISSGSEIDSVFQSDTHVLGRSEIDLGSGDDTLTMQRPAFSGMNVEYFGDLTLRPQEGNDNINITGFISRSVTVDDESGQLNLNINSADIYGTLKVLSTGANDSIRVATTNVRGDIHIDSGAGNDLFLFFGLANDIKVHSGDGNDSVQVTSSAIDELIVSLGSGNDVLDLASLFARDISVHGDDGDDVFNVAGVRAEEADFYGDKNFDVFVEPVLPPNEIRRFNRHTIERVDTF
jgi:hypothetical protein